MKNDRIHEDERRDRGRTGHGAIGSRRPPSPPRAPRFPSLDSTTQRGGPAPSVEQEVSTRHNPNRDNTRDSVSRRDRDIARPYRPGSGPSIPPHRRSQHPEEDFSRPEEKLGVPRSANQRRSSPEKRSRSRSPHTGSLRRKKAKTESGQGLDHRPSKPGPGTELSPRHRDTSPRQPPASNTDSRRRQDSKTRADPSSRSDNRDKRSDAATSRRARRRDEARARDRSRSPHNRSRQDSSSRRLPSRSPTPTASASRDRGGGREPGRRSRRRGRSKDRRRGRRGSSFKDPQSKSIDIASGPNSIEVGSAQSRAARRRPSASPDRHDGDDIRPANIRDTSDSPQSPRTLHRDEQGDGGRDAAASSRDMHVETTYPNMATRSNRRGSYQGNDLPRGHSHTPTPNSSYHNSPTSQGSQNGRPRPSQQQFSPQHQHASPFPQGNGPPTAPQAHQGQTGRSPPQSAPTGPMNQFQGNFRGNFRGGQSSFRGNPFPSGRGPFRAGSNFNGGAPQRNQGNVSVPGHGTRPQHSQGVCHDQGYQSPSRTSESGPPPPTEPSGMREGMASASGADGGKEVSLLPQHHTQGSLSQDREINPAPPTEPNSAKFSFAFGKSTKPTPTAPKPEISQKFNAVPKRDPPTGPAAGHRDRDIPPSAPTEPASVRARNEARQDFRRNQTPPSRPPRMRKVKKIMRRPVERPTLPDHLRESESVFYRKPGNESVVGSGTYGKVFKALHVYTKVQVALKRIRMDGERDGYPVTAVREIKLLQSLRHTNIVSLLEVMVEKNDCFMVFEYLSHDLTGLLNHPTFKLDLAQKKHLSKQLFEGLDYLHKRGVLHRDIKAANILVSSEGVLKLADFGLARFYAKRHQWDYTNRVITIWYRSPELLLGETQYGPPVDVWSAACVMVEIFTHSPIFPGDGTEVNQLDKIYSIMGTPSRNDWPGQVKMAWFELLRPGHRQRSVFREKYADALSPEAFKLLSGMLRFDPAKRLTTTEVLAHPYFTDEEPAPRQAIELQNLDGDWHEFESKALRRENERKDREARRAAREGRDRDRKRPTESDEPQREAKRAHVESKDERTAGAGLGKEGRQHQTVRQAHDSGV